MGKSEGVQYGTEVTRCHKFLVPYHGITHASNNLLLTWKYKIKVVPISLKRRK